MDPRAGLVATLVLALGCTTVEEQRWVEVRTANLRIFSNADEMKTREIATELEGFRTSVNLLFPATSFSTRFPTHAYLFDSTADFTPFTPGNGLLGYVLSTVSATYLGVDGTGNWNRIRRTIQHEYSHVLTYDASNLTYPLWFSEGFAEYLGSIWVTEDAIRIGDMPSHAVVASGPPIAVRTLLDIQSMDEVRDESVSLFYASSWLLTHYLYLGRSVAPADRSAQLRRYLELIAESVAPVEAFELAFGVTPEEMDRELVAYPGLAFQKLPGGQASYPDTVSFSFPGSAQLLPVLSLPRGPAKNSADLELRTLPPEEALLRLGDLLLKLGSERHRARAARSLRRALEISPNLAQAHALLALALPPGEEAAGHLERGLELGEGDPLVQLSAGDYFLRHAEDVTAQRESARASAELAEQHYTRALALARKAGGELAAAEVGMGRAELIAGDPEEAAALLESAYTRLGWNLSLALSLASAHLAAGHREQAVRYSQRVIGNTHSDEQRALAECIRLRALEQSLPAGCPPMPTSTPAPKEAGP